MLLLPSLFPAPSNAASTATINTDASVVKTLTYPNGRVLTYDYGTADGSDDAVTRPIHMQDGEVLHHAVFVNNGRVAISVPVMRILRIVEVSAPRG